MAQTVKSLSAIQKIRVWSLGQEDPLEKEMATHSNILAWKIPLKSLAGYSPWGRRESDTTERPSIYTTPSVSRHMHGHIPREKHIEKLLCPYVNPVERLLRGPFCSCEHRGSESWDLLLVLVWTGWGPRLTIQPPVMLERAPWRPHQVGRKSPRHLESPLVVVPGIAYTFSWCHMCITGAISLRSSELPCWPWTDRLGVKSVPIRSPGRCWPGWSPALGWGRRGSLPRPGLGRAFPMWTPESAALCHPTLSWLCLRAERTLFRSWKQTEWWLPEAAGWGWVGKCRSKGQTSSFKMSKFWASHVQWGTVVNNTVLYSWKWLREQILSVFTEKRKKK